MSVSKFDNQVATPRLADDKRLYRRCSARVQGVDDVSNVVNNRGHLVALLGLIAETVTSKVDRSDCMTQAGEVTSRAVPESGI
jgi:hypothetical protein